MFDLGRVEVQRQRQQLAFALPQPQQGFLFGDRGRQQLGRQAIGLRAKRAAMACAIACLLTLSLPSSCTSGSGSPGGTWCRLSSS